MASSSDKKNQTSKIFRDSRKKISIDHDFLPYACHYDKNTILTKNGEMMQVIRIVGLSNSFAASEIITLRETIRMAIADNFADGSFAFWFTTIRRKKNINPSGVFEDFFSREFDDLWVKKNQLDSHYINELFISIIVEDAVSSRGSTKAILSSFSSQANKKFYKNAFIDSYKKLSLAVKNLLLATEEYGARLLGVSELDGVLYSDPLSFFGKICNLHEDRYPLMPSDLSETLAVNPTLFGDREIEVIGDDFKGFAALFSLKEYFELSSVSLDKILQLPIEFIISQSFDFSYGKKDLADIEFQNYITKVSGDEEFRQISGLSEFFLESDFEQSNQKKYGKLQTTIMLINSNREGLNRDILSFHDRYSEMGLAFVREDVFLEHCFWSQMPANFRFLRRQKIVDISKIAGFSSLQSFPAGQISRNHWGPAVCVFKTIINTPYFFNFHSSKSPHCLIIGQKGYGRTVLTNFLLIQARRFKNRIFYLDFDQKAKCLISAIDGHYYDISCHEKEDPSYLHLCPFNINNSNDSETIYFLSDFIKKLVLFTKSIASNDQLAMIELKVRSVIENKITLFSQIIEEFNKPETSQIYEALSLWNGEELRRIFGSAYEINWKDEIISFDLTETKDQPGILLPIAFYLLGRIEKELDNSPTILVIKEANRILDAFGDDLVNFLEKMKSKNCVVVFVCEDNEQSTNKPEIFTLNQNISTKLILANSNPAKYHQEIYGLSEEEAVVLRDMNQHLHHFLLKSDEDVVIASLDLAGIPDVEKIFSANQETLSVFDEIVSQNRGETYSPVAAKVWIPQFFDIMEKLTTEKMSNQKEEARQANIQKRKARSSRGDY